MVRRRGKIMTELVEHAKLCLANTFVLYTKAHVYHWNVTGRDFPQLHEFFGSLYAELHTAIDDLAEQVRTLDSLAPFSLARMLELADIKEDAKIVTDPVQMIKNLMNDNNHMIQCLTECYKMAEEEKEYAYSNFIQDRLTAHAKHRWMLKSILE
jgi:starvation-inducible DNA-binding protein